MDLLGQLEDLRPPPSRETSPFLQTCFPEQENQVHNQLLSSELKTSEVLSDVNFKHQDAKPYLELPRRHKAPLTASGTTWGAVARQSGRSVVMDGHTVEG